MSDCIDHGQVGDKHGYGRLSRNNKRTFFHRYVYCDHNALHIDDIAGKVIRHTCDNPRCINPDHLLIGTQADNMRDVSIRRRHRCVTLTDEQVVFIRKHCRPNRHGDISRNPYSYSSLGRMFGVYPNAIRLVHLGLSFKHLIEQPA